MPPNTDDVHQVEVSTLEVFKHICVAASFHDTYRQIQADTCSGNLSRPTDCLLVFPSVSKSVILQHKVENNDFRAVGGGAHSQQLHFQVCFWFLYMTNMTEIPKCCQGGDRILAVAAPNRLLFSAFVL